MLLCHLERQTGKVKKTTKNLSVSVNHCLKKIHTKRKREKELANGSRTEVLNCKDITQFHFLDVLSL